MEKEKIQLVINTLASVEVKVTEAPKILGVINIMQEELKKDGE